MKGESAKKSHAQGIERLNQCVAAAQWKRERVREETERKKRG